MFLDIQQVDFPCETDVGLIHIHSIDVVVRAAKVKTDISAPQRIVFKAYAFKIGFFAWYDPSVEWIVFSRKLRPVGIYACFGKDNPFVANVNANAENGSEILSEKAFLTERSAVHNVQIHFYTVEKQLVA